MYKSEQSRTQFLVTFDDYQNLNSGRGHTMVHQYRPNFPHRFNEDGSFDSICAECHITVATARSEAALSNYERSHMCDPVRLYQVSQYRFGSGATAVGMQVT